MSESSSERRRRKSDHQHSDEPPLPRLPSSLYGSMLDAFGMSAESIAPSSETPPPSITPSEETMSRVFANRVDVGDVIEDRYDIWQQLEQDDVITLYLARDRTLQELVMLQVSMRREDAPQFRQQLLLARSVSHPNILRMHDFFETPGGPALVMDAADETLQHQLATRRREGRYEADELRTLAGDLGAALSAMHARGLVHGALNPRRVLLAEGTAKLMVPGPVTDRELALCGVSPQHAPPLDQRYHSPERLMDPSPSRADDVYALGLVLWEALTLGNVRTGVSPRSQTIWEDCHSTTVYDLSTPELRALFAALSPHPAMRPSGSRLKRIMTAGVDASGFGQVRPGIDPGPPPAFAEGFVAGKQALLITYSSTAPELVGSLLALEQRDVTLGRRDQSINVPERTLSRCHARLTWDRGSWHIADQKSANGTYLDGSYERQHAVLLRPGMEVQLGELRCMLVGFTDGSRHHWHAQQYLAQRDGLTGLHSGRHFLATIEEDALFATWADLPLHLACYLIQFPVEVRWVTAMLGLRQAAERLTNSTASFWPSVFTLGCTEKLWRRRDPHMPVHVFATLLGKSAVEPSTVAAEVAARVLTALPAGSRIVSGVASAAARDDVQDVMWKAVSAANANASQPP